MKKILIKSRKEVEKKFTKVFNGKINGLSTELQRILIDDMVTAFENRLNMLKMVQLDKRFWNKLMELNVYLYYIKALYSNIEYAKKRGL